MANNLRLPDGTSWPKPGPGHEAIENIGGPRWLGDEGPFTVSKEDFYILRSIVGAYDHLATHPVGADAVIKQLRMLRKAVRDVK